MTEWAQDVLVSGGVGILALLVVLENLFPPIPSEVILPLAGFLVFQGEISFPGAVAASTGGAVVGALIIYALGRYGGRPLLLRHGGLLRLTEKRLDRADDWFDRHGPKLVFFGRMVPGVRSVVSFPAGTSEMALRLFVGLTAAGSGIWNTALIGAGWALGARWRDVTNLIESVDIAIYAALALGVAAALVAARMRARNHAS